MATDPVQQINVEEYDEGFSTNLNASLREIARLEPSLDVPFLSVYLDWRPDGERPYRRSAKTLFDNRAEDLRDQFAQDSDAWKSLNADIERIKEFLRDDLDPSVHGVMIFANNARNVFETFVLALPVETRITCSPTPDLLPMARVVEDYPRYAVLLADQQEATLTIINRASRMQTVEIEGSLYPSRQKQGGWSQRRFQARVDERRSHFARAVAEETRRALREAGVTMLVVAGNDVVTSDLNQEFHDEVKKAIIGEIHFDLKQGTRSDLIKQTMPLVEEAERKREFAAVKDLKEAVGSGRGAIGIERTLRALERGQVMKLLMSSEFHQEGWADYALNVYGVGPVPEEHPAGGDVSNMYPVDLAEEIVRLTVVTDAEGEVIHANGGASAEFGDVQVGAILRFS